MPDGVRDVQRVCDRCEERGRDASKGSDAGVTDAAGAAEYAECARYACCIDFVAICSTDNGTFASARSGTSICTRLCSRSRFSPSICGR
jgi:hypothetical protein